MPYALWTRESVWELVKEKLGIVIPIRTVWHYLKRWGMTPQQPVKQAYEQQPARLQKWPDEEYPAIQVKAQEEAAEIYWGDVIGLRNDSQYERGRAPKGKIPVIRLNTKRVSINMILAITNQGKVLFKLFEDGMNATIIVDFLKCLVEDDAQRKFILVLDNLCVHHAKKVKEWLAGKEVHIEIFYLHAYSSVLNPDEYLNCDLKASVHSGKLARSKKQLKSKVISHMRMLQHKSDRVKKYFEHKKIRYAA